MTRTRILGFLAVVALIGSFLLTQSPGRKPGVLPTGAQTHVSTEQFILMGDVGTAAPQQFAVADTLRKKCESEKMCKAVFLLGDLIYELGIASADDPQLQTKLEVPYKDIDLPFYLVLGNHDYVGCATCYLSFATGHPKWHFPNRYYVQEFDNVAFFIIDTEQFDPDQRFWLNKELATNQKRWNIVLGHRPIISEEESKKGENWNGKKELQDIVCAGADFYISGHAHVQEERKQLPGCTARFLISGAGGSEVRSIAQPFTGAFHAEENGFLSLKVTGTTVQYQFVNKEGTILREQTIEKK